MDLALLGARLLLAAVFAVAGLAKLTDRAGTRRTLGEFGVPVPLAAVGTFLLPLVELVVAVVLVPAATAWWGALGALALFLLFVVGVGVMLARGRRPDCNCFGGLTSKPIGSATIIRNAALAAVAGFVVLQGRGGTGGSALGWLNDLNGFQRGVVLGGAVLLGLLVIEGWSLLQVLGQNGRLLARLEALEVRIGEAAASPPGLSTGLAAPAFALPDLDGRRHTLDSLRAAGRPVLLLFVDPGCAACGALLPDAARWQREHAGRLSIALISQGSVEANRAKMAGHAIAPLLLQQGREVHEAYRMQGTPSAVIVRPDGTIAGPPAAGTPAIQALVARVTPAQLGDPAPAVSLPDLDGREVALADFRGRSTLVLFWRPGCDFCRQMLPHIKVWEAAPPLGAPQLLFISSEPAAVNAAQGLQAPILLDESFETGRAFGATGTPSAVLLDAEGFVASQLAVGAAAVFALANNGRAVANGYGPR